MIIFIATKLTEGDDIEGTTVKILGAFHTRNQGVDAVKKDSHGAIVEAVWDEFAWEGEGVQYKVERFKVPKAVFRS